MKPKKKINKTIPIQYILSIPVVKANLYDEKGNEIKDIVNIQQFKDGYVVMTKNGGMYSTKDLLLGRPQ